LNLKQKIDRIEDPERLLPGFLGHVSDELQRIESTLEAATPSDVARLADISVRALGAISQNYADPQSGDYSKDGAERARKDAVKLTRNLLSRVREGIKVTTPDLCAEYIQTIASIDFKAGINEVTRRRGIYLKQKMREEAEQGFENDVIELEGKDAAP